MEQIKVKDIFDSKLSPCMITNTDEYLFCFDPISILSQDPITLFEENLPKFMCKPAEWPQIETIDRMGRIMCEDTVPDDKFPSKCSELLSQDELWSPRTSPLSSPISSCSPAMSPLTFGHDEESMDITTFVASEDSEEDSGYVSVCASPVLRNVDDHHYHLVKKDGGRRRPRDTVTVSKKTVRNRKHKGKPGRPRKSANMKSKKVNEMEKLRSPKTTKRKVRQAGILQRTSKVTPALIKRTISDPPPSPPITPPPPSSSQQQSCPVLSLSLISSSSSDINSVTSVASTAPTVVTTVSSDMKSSLFLLDDDRSLSDKTKRRKCMSHTEKAVHNELERRRRAQMSELLSELRVVIDAVKDDPKASQKRIVDEALRCIKQAKRDEKEMQARVDLVKSENESLKAKLRELSSEWHDLHGHSKVVICRDTDEDDECSVVEIM